MEMQRCARLSLSISFACTLIGAPRSPCASVCMKRSIDKRNIKCASREYKVRKRYCTFATVSMRYCTAGCCYWWVYLRRSILFIFCEIFERTSAVVRVCIHHELIIFTRVYFLLQHYSLFVSFAICKEGVLCRYIDCVCYFVRTN